MDKTNRYKSKEKKKAYESALKKAATLSDTLLWSPVAYLAIPYPNDIASKAIRVERGRRR